MLAVFSRLAFNANYSPDCCCLLLEDGGGGSVSISSSMVISKSKEAETVSKSEKGLDRTVQGESVTLLWNAALGGASLRVRP